jgi:hypothetical protein
MEFICPIGGPGTPAWHAAVHLGLTGFVVVAGAAFLVLAVVAYRRGDPSRHGRQRPEAGAQWYVL